MTGEPDLPLNNGIKKTIANAILTMVSIKNKLYALVLPLLTLYLIIPNTIKTKAALNRYIDQRGIISSVSLKNSKKTA